jgi:hypothetical protein
MLIERLQQVLRKADVPAGTKIFVFDTDRTLEFPAF